MNPLSVNCYKNHRFPAEIISHGVWLCYRFCLSYRDVEELLFARDIQEIMPTGNKLTSPVNYVIRKIMMCL